MASPTSLVYYSAVAKGTVVVAEYVAQGNTDLSSIAARCLENIPPLHSNFSYTTNQRRFICILDGIFTYCGIIDEAVSKVDAFSFLHKIRDAFRTLHKGRGPDSETLTLGAHLLDEEMVPIMRQHAALLVGVPQREKTLMDMELQAERDAVMDPEVSSPTAVSPLDEKEESEERQPSDERRSNGGAINEANDVEILVEGVGGPMEMDGSMHSQNMWWLIVKQIAMLDGMVCLFLLPSGLGFVGTSAASRNRFAVGLPNALPNYSLIDCLLHRSRLEAPYRCAGSSF